MNFSWETTLQGHLCVTAFDPGRWEGSPPVSTYRLQHAPHVVSPDRMAVAATLLFEPFLNGGLFFPSAINVVTASAIEAFLRESEARVREVDEGPKPILRDEGVLLVERDALGLLTKLPASISHRVFADLRSDEYVGALARHRGYAVATNGYLFDEESWARGLLAGAVIVAGSLSANEIVVRKSVLSPQRLASAQLLLNSVGLGVREDS